MSGERPVLPHPWIVTGAPDYIRVTTPDGRTHELRGHLTELCNAGVLQAADSAKLIKEITTYMASLLDAASFKVELIEW